MGIPRGIYHTSKAVDCTLLLENFTVEDNGKYKVTARNDLGESNATISLNLESKSNNLGYLDDSYGILQ